LIWQQVVRDCIAGQPQQIYDGGRIAGDRFMPARWDLLPPDSYMWASVQTVRGCPKHCSFCSVWRTDGQQPRSREVESVVGEIVELRRRGFRFIALADDNFYPVPLSDIAMARRKADPPAQRAAGDPAAALRSDEDARATAEGHRVLHADHDGSRRRRGVPRAMRRARIKGALVGVESVTSEGLKDVYKGFNLSGESLVERLKKFRKHGVHVLGSFIFGLPSDREQTFDATLDLADRADLTFAQFVLLTPFPGTLDFEKWAKSQENPETIDGVPVTTHWLIPEHKRPKIFSLHPTMSAEQIRVHTQNVWDQFYSWRRIWNRSGLAVTSVKSRVAFVLVSKLYRQMYANTGIATDSARINRSAKRAQFLGRMARRLFMGRPMPELQMPQ
jgi:radical SAM superfamily enzyme YgiQ (UPF0313 family)